MKIKDFSKIYIAILFLHLITIYKEDYGPLYIISKPMLVFCLLSFWVHRSSLIELKGKHSFSLALLFCLTGDILLMFQNPEWLFYAGMGAFGIAHVFFFLFYLNQSGRGLHQVGFMVGGLLTIISATILYYLYPLQMPMELAVYFYAFLFGLHLIWNAGSAFTLKGGYLTAFGGATLFLISDMLLLWFKLQAISNPISHTAVMVTYGIGIFFITTGIVRKESLVF